MFAIAILSVSQKTLELAIISYSDQIASSALFGFPPLLKRVQIISFATSGVDRCSMLPWVISSLQQCVGVHLLQCELMSEWSVFIGLWPLGILGSGGSGLSTARTSTWSAPRLWISWTSFCAMTTRRGSPPARPWTTLTSVSPWPASVWCLWDE